MPEQSESSNQSEKSPIDLSKLDLGNLPSQIQAKIQTQFVNQVAAAKTLSQDLSPKLDRTLTDTKKHLEENLEVADAWAIAQTNLAIEQSVAHLENIKINIKTKAQKKYQDLGEATKQVAKTSDHLQNTAKDVVKSAWQKINNFN
jgi:hypothetical protein